MKKVNKPENVNFRNEFFFKKSSNRTIIELQFYRFLSKVYDSYIIYHISFFSTKTTFYDRKVYSLIHESNETGFSPLIFFLLKIHKHLAVQLSIR